MLHTLEIYRITKLYQKALLETYFDMNIEQKEKNKKKKQKGDCEKDFSKLMNNSVFEKIMKNVRKNRDVKLVLKKAGRNYLVSEPKYPAAKFFSKIF